MKHAAPNLKEVRPTKSETNIPIDCDAETVTTLSPESLGRTVDWCLGFNVNEDGMLVIETAYNGLPDNGRSLNQSLSNIKDSVPPSYHCDVGKDNLQGLVQKADRSLGSTSPRRRCVAGSRSLTRTRIFDFERQERQRSGSLSK